MIDISDSTHYGVIETYSIYMIIFGNDLSFYCFSLKRCVKLNCLGHITSHIFIYAVIFVPDIKIITLWKITGMLNLLRQSSAATGLESSGRFIDQYYWYCAYYTVRKHNNILWECIQTSLDIEAYKNIIVKLKCMQIMFFGYLYI